MAYTTINTQHITSQDIRSTIIRPSANTTTRHSPQPRQPPQTPQLQQQLHNNTLADREQVIGLFFFLEGFYDLFILFLFLFLFLCFYLHYIQRFSFFFNN
jgi:hypothetical protein